MYVLHTSNKTFSGEPLKINIQNRLSNEYEPAFSFIIPYVDVKCGTLNGNLSTINWKMKVLRVV